MKCTDKIIIIISIDKFNDDIFKKSNVEIYS